MSIHIDVYNLTRPQLQLPGPLEIANGISPALQLGSNEGPVYIGESFSSLIVVNSGADTDLSIGVAVDLTLPSQQVVSLLYTEAANRILPPNGHIEEMVQYELKEMGIYSMLISVYFTKGGEDTESKVPVRKTCRFTANPCLNIKTKVSTTKSQQLTVETQIENISKTLLTLETVRFLPNPGWDARILREELARLHPSDVYQTCFVLDRTDGRALGNGGPLGRLTMSWRREMGKKGWLTTGLLGF